MRDCFGVIHVVVGFKATGMTGASLCQLSRGQKLRKYRCETSGFDNVVDAL